jgi:hypothetical protein
MRRISSRRPPESRATAAFPGPAEIPQLPQSMMASPDRLMDLNIVGVTSVAWELFDFGMNKIPKSDYTDAVVRHIKAMQTPAGNWSTNESRRPPMAAGDFQAAALSIYSLKQYAQDSDKASADAVVAKAVKWLESAKAHDHAGSRVPRARPRMGQCGARHHSRGAARLRHRSGRMADGTNFRKWRRTRMPRVRRSTR